MKSDLTLGVGIAYALRQAGRTQAASALVERLLSVARDAFVPERYSGAREGFLYAELLHGSGFHDHATEIWDLAARRDSSTSRDSHLLMAVSKMRVGVLSLEQALAGIATADERVTFMIYTINDAGNRGQAGQIVPLVEMLEREMAVLPPWPVGDISSEALYQALIRLVRAGAVSEALRMADFPPDLLAPALAGMLEAALGRIWFDYHRLQ